VADMLVREIMTSPAYSVHEEASLEEALRLMATARVTGLPVVDGGGHVVGIISEADLLKADLEPDPRAHARPSRQSAESLLTAVGQVMTVHPHTVREDTDVAELAHTFANTPWKSVPVVRGDVLLGVVSRSDVIRALSRSDEEIASEISRTLAETGLAGLARGRRRRGGAHHGDCLGSRARSSLLDRPVSQGRSPCHVAGAGCL